MKTGLAAETSADQLSAHRRHPKNQSCVAQSSSQRKRLIFNISRARSRLIVGAGQGTTPALFCQNNSIEKGERARLGRGEPRLAAHRCARNGLTVWCLRTPFCSARGGPNGSRGGCAPQKINCTVPALGAPASRRRVSSRIKPRSHFELDLHSQKPTATVSSAQWFRGGLRLLRVSNRRAAGGRGRRRGRSYPSSISWRRLRSPCVWSAIRRAE